MKSILYVETQQMVPAKYLKHIEGTQGLFCFFDGEKLVILLSGFQKKTQKTPKGEIDRALKLMNEYFDEKDNGR